jgi:hypothetical protein
MFKHTALPVGRQVHLFSFQRSHNRTAAQSLAHDHLRRPAETGQTKNAPPSSCIPQREPRFGFRLSRTLFITSRSDQYSQIGPSVKTISENSRGIKQQFAGLSGARRITCAK